MNTLVKKLEVTEIDTFLELIQLFEAVFEMKDFSMPPVQHLQELLAQKTFLVFVALHNGKVAGGLTAYSMRQYYNTREAVYVYDLAVASSMQRKGIGSALIDALTTHCKKSGIELVFLEAEESDLHAIEFYRSTGADEEKVRFFSYQLN